MLSGLMGSDLFFMTVTAASVCTASSAKPWIRHGISGYTLGLLVSLETFIDARDYLHIVANCVHLFMSILFPDRHSYFQ